MIPMNRQMTAQPSRKAGRVMVTMGSKEEKAIGAR